MVEKNFMKLLMHNTMKKKIAAYGGLVLLAFAISAISSNGTLIWRAHAAEVSGDVDGSVGGSAVGGSLDGSIGGSVVGGSIGGSLGGSSTSGTVGGSVGSSISGSVVSGGSGGGGSSGGGSSRGGGNDNDGDVLGVSTGPTSSITGPSLIYSPGEGAVLGAQTSPGLPRTSGMSPVLFVPWLLAMLTLIGGLVYYMSALESFRE